MNCAVAIFERLLSGDLSQKEHILETMSAHLDDAQGRMSRRFDQLAGEVSAVFGTPGFCASPSPEDKVKTSLPGWSVGTPRKGGSLQTLRMAYWQKTDSTLYLLMRTEIHAQKEKPLYFDLVLGARRRHPTLVKVDRLRQKQKNEHWISKVLPFLAGWPSK